MPKLYGIDVSYATLSPLTEKLYFHPALWRPSWICTKLTNFPKVAVPATKLNFVYRCLSDPHWPAATVETSLSNRLVDRQKVYTDLC